LRGTGTLCVVDLNELPLPADNTNATARDIAPQGTLVADLTPD
jgi:hypothetical protein